MRATRAGAEDCVVNGLADLVRIHTAAHETTIHAYLRLDGAA